MSHIQVEDPWRFKTMGRRFSLYYHTLKHMKGTQIWARLYHFLKRAVLYQLGPLVAALYEARVRLERPQLRVQSQSYHPWQERVIQFAKRDARALAIHSQRANDILENRFTFLNQQIIFTQRIDWCPEGTTKIWWYNLHYFAYAIDLGIAYLLENDERLYLKFKSLILDWIRDNKIAQGVGWDPYPTSLRIINWISAYRFLGDRMRSDVHFENSFLKSLYLQSLFLERNLEYHLGGNHLLENGRALLFAGTFFRGPTADDWREKGKRILWEGLQEQILADGGHVERSPMYHSLMVQAYLESLMLLREVEEEPPSWVLDKVKAMLDFLCAILHPDGEIPLFNDAAMRMARRPEDLLALGTVLFREGRYKRQAQKFGFYPYLWLGDHGAQVFGEIRPLGEVRCTALETSGYYIVRDPTGSRFMIIDCGPMGPDYLPGHGHCDCLSYELFIGGLRFIVDSGVYEYYGEPNWRHYWRSTRAHNTVVIDGEEQSEIWGEFRVARRAYPTKVIWINRERVTVFRGGHDGYTRLRDNVLHQRSVFFVENTFWIVFDEILGSGNYEVESYIHLHPQVRTEIVRKTPEKVTITGTHVAGQCLQITPFGASSVRIYRGQEEPLQGWYSPEFGLRRQNYVVSLGIAGELPLQFGYVLLPRRASIGKIVWQREGDSLFIELTISGRHYRVGHTGQGVFLNSTANLDAAR